MLKLWFIIFLLSKIAVAKSTMSKFSANLIQLYSERPFLERYKAAKDAGFKAVETGFPYGFSLEQVVKAKNDSGVEQVLLNSFTGDLTKGEVGFAAVPGQEDDFKKSIETTLKYAKALGVRKIHIMSGRVDGEITEIHNRVFESNLKYAASLLSKENILGVIEPISKYVLKNYYLNSYDKALTVVKSINSPNLKIMLDIFHCQMIRGDITNTIEELGAYIGHVQIAQAPNRDEPSAPGELNYKYILEVLQKKGYNDWIGLEHKCPNGVPKALEDLRKMGYEL